jgi:hypothetical protein
VYGGDAVTVYGGDAVTVYGGDGVTDGTPGCAAL